MKIFPRRWFFAVATGLGSWACGGQGGKPDSAAAMNAGAPAASSIPQAMADTVTVSLPLALTAQTYVDHDALVFARARGIVESVYVDLGARVERGQLLAELEHVDQEIALGQAKQVFMQAERNVERQRELTKSGFVSIADSEAVEFTYRRAQLALRQAERNYDLTRVVAPFAGVVTARQV
ncbi:MAG: efflux RND transporter periplasmic adaptor subunit, partial [Gemmatimonadales bacterium]